MKGIIVVDIPENCSKCDRLWHYSDGLPYCEEKDREIGFIEEKPDWCPIKPVPEKKEFPECFMYGEIYGEEIGWNACIDEILKGE